mgnify:CR=1 FL=1
MTGFDDLNEAGKEQVDDESEGVDDSQASPAVDGAETADEASPDRDVELTNPAFPFDEAIQAQIYPRNSTHDEFTDFLDIEVKRLLRDRDIRNEEGRELHEAVLRVAMEHPEDIAEVVEQQRTE